VTFFGDEAETLDRDLCLALLARTNFGRISINIRALPVIVPVTYHLEDDGILMRVGKAQEGAAANSAVVGFQADGFDEDRVRGWTVSAVGRSQPVEEPSNVEEPRLFRLQPVMLAGRWLEGL
jgi:hypothetical protein